MKCILHNGICKADDADSGTLFGRFASRAGALLGGYVGEHAGLRYALGLGGVDALTLAAWAWRHPVIRNVRSLPTTSTDQHAATTA